MSTNICRYLYAYDIGSLEYENLSKWYLIIWSQIKNDWLYYAMLKYIVQKDNSWVPTVLTFSYWDMVYFTQLLACTKFGCINMLLNTTTYWQKKENKKLQIVRSLKPVRLNTHECKCLQMCASHMNITWSNSTYEEMSYIYLEIRGRLINKNQVWNLIRGNIKDHITGGTANPLLLISYNIEISSLQICNHHIIQNKTYSLNKKSYWKWLFFNYFTSLKLDRKIARDNKWWHLLEEFF